MTKPSGVATNTTRSPATNDNFARSACGKVIRPRVVSRAELIDTFFIFCPECRLVAWRRKAGRA
jgi:hypothetical protein